MCKSMVDIQSVAAEIRRGKKRRYKKKETTGQKYNGPLLHRVAVKSKGLHTLYIIVGGVLHFLFLALSPSVVIPLKSVTHGQCDSRLVIPSLALSTTTP